MSLPSHSGLYCIVIFAATDTPGYTSVKEEAFPILSLPMSTAPIVSDDLFSICFHCLEVMGYIF